MSGWSQLRDVLLNGSPQTLAGQKIRQDAANDGDKYPFVIGRRVDVYREFGLDNTLLSVKEQYGLECWGETREQACALEDQAVALLIAAGLPPDPNGPDGLDPTVDVRCSVLYVSIWLDIEIPDPPPA
jgi:hypothetical protein